MSFHPRALRLIFTGLLLWLPPVTAQGAQEPAATQAPSDAPVVVAIDISGVESLSERELRQVIQTRARSWLPWRDAPRLDPATLEADVQRVEAFYAERGFPLASAASSLEPAGRGEVRVRIAVEEGEAVRLAGFAFEGFEGLVSAEALDAVADRAPLQPGDLLARAGIVATAQQALDLVRDAGYPHARVTAVESTVGFGQVRVTLTADRGVIGLFGRVDIAGHTRVDDSVIRRYVRFRPGERFSLQPIRETHRRLTALGLFESVDIEVVDPEAARSDVDTIVRVVERDQRGYQVSFGYGTEEQLSTEAEWRHLNFLGGARRLSLLGRWSWLDRGGQGELVEPYFFHPDVSLGIVGQVWSLDERFFDVLSAGGGASVSYRHRLHNVVSVTFSQRYQRTRIDDSLAGLGFEELGGQQDGLLTSLQVDLVRDTRDAPADPRSGYRAALRLEQAGGWLPGAFDLYTMLVDARHFQPLGPVTLAHRVQYGSVAPLAGAPEVPLFRRFFLGGADSVRGWGRLEVSPLSPNGQPVGGRAFAAATSELRVPLGAGIGAAVFADAGNVWRDAWSLRPATLRYSAGLGLRYASPFGPVRIDAGYQLNPIAGLRIDGEPQDRRWRFHVSFGPSF